LFRKVDYDVLKGPSVGATTGRGRIFQRELGDRQPIDEKREQGEKESNKKGEKGE